MKCKCPPNSPFHWKHDKSPTVFARDKYFTPGGAASAIGATQRVENDRQKGGNMGVIKGISRDREAEVLRIRMFSTFTRAMAQK
jgi:hypothetical protein